ncbi:monocarboxylate transporter 14-like [Chrysoperla carnea]|uniref:monocarboxylate transporter 14-like n=1 Tax=Chrysoperla carnea TaxID=189513 RepID=UPI001D0609D0|nr:monocarboxylate transporter 14-like [Chrysoperla carnea]
MEPQKESQVNGLAPIVGWSNVTPSLKSSPSKTPSSLTTPPVTKVQSPLITNIPEEAPSDNNNKVRHRNNKENQIILSDDNERVRFLNDLDKDSIMSSSSSSISNSSICSIKLGSEKPKYPDGGWGWMVVLSSLVISMIADGISFSFGLVYIEFLHEYGESKSKTAWIGSLFMAVPLLSGPIMSALVDKYGCRKMTMLGGIISGTGFILSSISNTIELQFLTFGVIAGIGLGLCYVTAVVSIAYWFDKKRTLATGLGACGTGVGTFVYAPMTQFFIEEYGWRGTVLLLAGTFLNMCVCGAVMRDPEWWTIEQQKLQSKNIKGSSSTASISGSRSVGGESTFPGVEEIRKLMKSGESPEYILTTLATSTGFDQSSDNANKNTKKQHRSVVNLPTFVKQSEKVPIEVLEQLSSNKRLYKVILENYPKILSCRSSSDKALNTAAENDVSPGIPVTMSVRLKKTKRQNSTDKQGVPTEATTNVNEPLLQQKVNVKIVKSNIKKVHPTNTDSSKPWLVKQFSNVGPSQHGNYLQNIKVHRNSVMYRGAILNTKKYRLRASSCPDIFRNSMITLAREEEEKWYSEFVDLLKGIMDFSMFLELHFLFLSISTILLFIWFIVPYFYIAEHLTRHGYTENECSKLISLIGVTNTIGMIGLGWAGDQPWVSVTKTFSCCLFLCGFATAAMPFFTDSPYFLVGSAALFGLFFASSFSFTPVVLVSLIPIERFTTGYGLILLCQGIGNLTGPPLAGLLFDLTQSWDLSFYTAGFWIFISGIFILLIPYTKNRKIIGSGPLEKEIDRVSMA